MAKYSDIRSAGRSRLVPFRIDETHSDRHHRRLLIALRCEPRLRQWCEARNVCLSLKNQGHHWAMVYMNPSHATNGSKPPIAEWWPSTAKLVFNRNFSTGIHVHDIDQVKSELTRRWRLCKT